jgi:hypothetical protein
VDQDTGKFFWFGEYKIEGQVEGGGISVYSSDDLVTWDPHGLALEPIPGHPYIDTHHIIQRPKVVYSEGTGKYHVRKAVRCVRPLLIDCRCGGMQTTPPTAGYDKASHKLTTSLDHTALWTQHCP